MTPALVLMAVVGAVIAVAGGWVLTRRAAAERQVYAIRIGGIMLAALGLILIVFAFTYAHTALSD